MGDRSRVLAGSVAATIVALLIALSMSSMTHAQEPIILDGPGIDWDLPESHMLYLLSLIHI